MWKVRELADKVTNVVMNYTDIEAKVREATNDEAWGPTGSIKHELSQATFSYDQFPEVMGMLWKRIAENKKSPRRIYKSLLLLHHLLLNGSDRVIRSTQDRIYELRSLTDYHVVYEPGFSLNSIIPPEVTKDGEMNVRVKAKEIVELVQDDERLREDRKKAKKNRDKYVGIGSDRMMTSRWGGSSMGSSEFDDIGEELGSPKTPPSLSTPSPKKEAARKIVIRETSSPAVDHDLDDFNPREGEDFGDFKTASSSSSTSKQGTGGCVGGVSSGGGDLFAADFQTAFGSGDPSSTSQPELLSSNSLFTDNVTLINPTTTITSNSTAAVGAATLDNQMDLLGVFDNSAAISSIPAMGNVIQQKYPQEPLISQHSQPITQHNSQNFHNNQPFLLPQQQQQQQLFQQSSPLLLDSILQPVIKSNVQSNNINNNSAVANSQPVSLKGTTWSDLNFSIDDLTINPSRNQSTIKPTINQLKLNQHK